MRDIMIDLETLSTRPDAMIVAIGAVKFGPEGLGEEYYAVVDTRYAVGHIDAMTVAWWMRQGEEAREIFQEGFRNTKHIAAALEGLIGFVGDAPDQVRVWGHGASFDLPIIESAFRACCRKTPWGQPRHPRHPHALRARRGQGGDAGGREASCARGCQGAGIGGDPGRAGARGVAHLDRLT